MSCNGRFLAPARALHRFLAPNLKIASVTNEVSNRVRRERGWAGGRARGAGILQTDGRDGSKALTYDLRTK